MRRKVKAGYARGYETEARILSVAVKLFGTRGFDSVSTREIADAASVPPASLRYYYKSKEGLYIACLQHIQTLSIPLMEPHLKVAEELLQAPAPDVDAVIDAYCNIQEALIDASIGAPDAATTALFMIRHDLPSSGGESSFKIGSSATAYRLMACFMQMMKLIGGNAFDTQTALIVAGLINSPIGTIQLKRMRLAEMGWEITPERLLWLKQTIRFQSTATLRAYCANPLMAARSNDVLQHAE